jgi:hypothetical protein
VGDELSVYDIYEMIKKGQMVDSVNVGTLFHPKYRPEVEVVERQFLNFETGQIHKSTVAINNRSGREVTVSDERGYVDLDRDVQRALDDVFSDRQKKAVKYQLDLD